MNIENYEERYILEGYVSGGNFTVITEYLVDNLWGNIPTWVEVRRESNHCNYIPYPQGEVVDYTSDGITYRKTFSSPKKEGIWFNNKLPYFKIKKEHELYEPIYKSFADANFYITEMNEISEIPELTVSLNRMDEDMMYFNFNWIPEDKNPTPLRTILGLMNKRMDVDVCFHDKENVIMYKVKLTGFRFEKIHDLRNYNWSDTDIKELCVQYNFDEEEIITD
jgi:hypothetical protein